MHSLSAALPRCGHVAPFRPTRSSACCRALAPVSAGHTTSSSSRAQLTQQDQTRLASRARLAVVRRAAADEPASAFDYEEPETAKEGIDLGLVLCKQGKWQQALGVFEKSLTLPGTGIKRFRDKPRLISDGEKMALLYNIACCQSQLQDARSSLVALGGCLEAGYADFGQVRTDPDLEFVRSDSRFEGLMERFERTASGGIFDGFNLGGLFK